MVTDVVNFFAGVALALMLIIVFVVTAWAAVEATLNHFGRGDAESEYRRALRRDPR